MPLDRCLFAAQLDSSADRAAVEARVARLRRLYGRLGEVHVETAFLEQPRVLLGVLRVGGEARLGPVTWWGARLPARWRDARVLAESGAAELRDLPDSLAVMAHVDDRVILITGPGGLQALFRCRGDGVTAWSTHALAAAVIARAHAEVDHAAVASLITWEFVAGDATLLHGTRAVAPASRIELDPGGASETVCWEGRDRWAPLPPQQAHREAERALLGSLSASLSAARRPVLGLTGGVDSRAVAVALRELGIDVAALTYLSDAAAYADAEAAAGIATRLGLAHDVARLSPRPASHARAEALWTDGAAPIGLGHVAWPRGISHWIVGVGGEVGRAFYYRWTGPRSPSASPRLLERVMLADLELDLGGADPEVRRRLRDTLRELLAEAATSGHRGWSVLDVLYGEQRVRRWARAMAPRLGADWVAPFASQRVMRALASLPLEDRRSDGFARRFIAARVPELVPQPPPAPRRRPLPPLLRREAVLAARRARRALGLPPLGRRDAEPWYRRPPWSDRREFVDWLIDGVLASRLLEEAMGGGWLRETRRNFLRGEPHAAYLASWAAGPVALAEELAAGARR